VNAQSGRRAASPRAQNANGFCDWQGDEDDDDEEDADDLRQYVVDVKSMVVTSGFALGAGFLGGMLGLGGGTIISPLFIEMGMHPQVNSGFSCVVLFISQFH
jgi:hypothetical protein